MSGGTANIGTAIGRGRPPRPTSLKRADGTLVKRRENPDEPRLAGAEIPPAPRGLDAVTRVAWDELRNVINTMRTVTAADLIGFELVVDALSVARRAAAELRDEGITVEALGSRGQLTAKPHPATATLLSAQKLVWYGLSRFGLSPADRARVWTVTPSGGGRPEDEFSQP